MYSMYICRLRCSKEKAEKLLTPLNLLEPLFDWGNKAYRIVSHEFRMVQSFEPAWTIVQQKELSLQDSSHEFEVV